MRTTSLSVVQVSLRVVSHCAGWLQEGGAQHNVEVLPGAVGLEVAGEIVDMYKDKKVTVVDANAALLPEELGWYRSVGDRFEGLLKKAGVKVLHGTRVTSPQASSPVPVEVTLSDGTSETGLYLAATGVKPQAGFLPASLLTEKGFVDTTPTLQAKQDAHIFAVGDASNNERKLALVINNQLPVLSHNLIQLMANDGASASLQQYGGDTRTLMGLITFGKGAGGGQVGPIRFPSVSARPSLVLLTRNFTHCLAAGNSSWLLGSKAKTCLPPKHWLLCSRDVSVPGAPFLGW